MRLIRSTATRGFTLVELLVSGAIASTIGIAVFMFMHAGMFLAAKNLSLNLTSNSMRTALDRVENVLQQGDNNPSLIDATGAPATAPAAGVKVDQFLGAPYVVTAPVTGLPATTTSMTLTRSTNALASPPLPKAGDVIRIDGTDATVRPRVASVVVGAINSARQPITVTLTEPLGTPVIFVSSTVITAKLVRPVAFIVLPNGSRKELRYYDRFEPVPNVHDATQYVVVSDQIGLQGEDATPFSMSQIAGKNFVAFSLRVRASDYDRRLFGKQVDEFNTFSRVETYVRPKVNP
ncbi:MAG: hypothetical protein JWQ44_1815 [Chthoniobacter sp.]|jgi:hypothetical protein|nr:hypothetical protein [Chthoniobacter sp.]